LHEYTHLHSLLYHIWFVLPRTPPKAHARLADVVVLVRAGCGVHVRVVRAMIVKKASGHGGKKVWYDRSRSKSTGERWRHYHVFGLARVVCKDGSLYRFIIGPWVIAFRFRGTKGG